MLPANTKEVPIFANYESEWAEKIAAALIAQGYDAFCPETHQSLALFERKIDNERLIYPFVIVDMDCNEIDGTGFIKDIRVKDDQTPILAISADFRLYNEALHAGANHMVIKAIGVQNIVSNAASLRENPFPHAINSL